MKKISAVLLVLVLVGSVVFAGFTGYARTGVGYNLDTTAYGFIKKATSVSVDVSLLEVVGEKKSEGDVYADIKAVLTFTYDNADTSAVDNTDVLDIDTSFKHAKIVGKDWYVGILNGVRAANFATSAIDSTEVARAANDLGYAFDDGTYYADVIARGYFDRNAGLELGYKNYVVGFGLNGNGNAGTYDVFGSLKTPEYEVADGVKVQLGASGKLVQAAAPAELDKSASAHAKVAYASDKLTASVGADVIIDGGLHADAAAKVVYDNVTVDGYYATDTQYWNTDDAVYVAGGTANDLLSAKVAVALDAMTVTVTGKDLINTQNLSASVKFNASEELAVTARGGYKVSTKVANGGADVVYKTADYTAKLGGTYYTTDVIKLNASVESTTLVPGATLLLAYAGDDILSANATAAADEDNGDKGSVYAYVKIAF